MELSDLYYSHLRAHFAETHEVSAEESITLFQPKDGGNRNRGTLSCPSKLGVPKIIQNLPNNIPNWKNMFFYVFSTNWEYDMRCPSVKDLKTWFTERNTIYKFFYSFHFISFISHELNLACFDIVVKEKRPTLVESE